MYATGSGMDYTDISLAGRYGSVASLMAQSAERLGNACARYRPKFGILLLLTAVARIRTKFDTLNTIYGDVPPSRQNVCCTLLNAKVRQESCLH